MLVEFFFEGSACRRIWAWAGLLVFLSHQAFKAYLSWAINDFYESFYNILQHQAESGSGDDANAEMRAEIYASLWDFAVIVAPAVVVHPLAGLIRNSWVFSWRRVLMKSYLNRWNTAMMPIEGASQRVHEDTQRFASGIQSCVAVVLQSIFTLAVFCPMLYELDPQLMGIAIGAAAGGLLVSVLVGWPLVGLEVNNQKVEAELRKKLVLLEAEQQETYRGGTPYTPFIRVFRELSINYRRLYLSFAALSTWLAFYEQIAVILPYVLVAPRLFAADASKRWTLGQLVKVSNSFGKVFDSLNVISDSWLAVNEWRSCLRRLREFEAEVSQRSPGAPARLAEVGVEMTDPGLASTVVQPEPVVDGAILEPPWIGNRRE